MNHEFGFCLLVVLVEATVFDLVTCLATSPNSLFDFLVTPAFCILDKVGSFSNILRSKPTLTFCSWFSGLFKSKIACYALCCIGSEFNGRPQKECLGCLKCVFVKN